MYQHDVFLKKMFPLGIRGATLASKFLLIIFMAKEFSIKDIGVYALVVSGISYLGYLLGFDFYTYSSREVVVGSREYKSGKIKNQFSFYFSLYVAVIIITTFTYYAVGFESKYIYLFCVILILEHFSQEVMRLLVIFGMPILANIQFFVRGGLWAYLFIIYMLCGNNASLEKLWFFWLFGDLLSLLFIVPIFRIISLSSYLSSRVDWRWIFRGLKVCMPLLLATLALRGIFTADRYLINTFSNKTDVGAYSYFSSFSAALMAFVDAGVVVIFYPKLVKYYKNSDLKSFDECKKKFYKSVIITGSLVSACLAIIVPLISYYLHKSDLVAHQGVFYVLLLGAFIYCISLVPHFELYAKGMDRQIIVSTVISFLLGLVTMSILGFYFSSYGIAFGQLIAITLMCYIKHRMVNAVRFSDK
ncbi:lipopolysaccharide biosynthesis protein [Rahnella victoriana]|uniref:lipopolysaccharide biosynthesis protein n=1 Tax=Rahnella victoriana TaxID=1510570 RepID=UPI001E326FD3|nr:hypothetical protein [Rahnella victoriana]UHM89922.1 hypothetical protein J9880_16660 [Rahnella victoriana]